MSPGFRRVLPCWVAAVAFLLLLLALFWRVWTPIQGARRSFAWDAQWEYWGDLQFQHDAYADGELPLWNPFDRTGYPVHADPQAGLLYPPNWLLLALSAAVGGVPFDMVSAKIILHFWLACFGVFIYLRRRGLHTAACYAGGAIFVIGYPHLQNLFSALNWNIAWAPWLLTAVDHWAARPTRARGALVALIGALCALAGGPASFWYSLLVAVPYAAWAIAHGAHSPEGGRDYVRRALVSGAASLGLFLAMVAAQFASTSAVVGETVRSKRDLSFIVDGAIGLNDVAGLAIPRMVGANTYVGAAAVLWAAVSLSAFFTPRRLVLAGVAALGIGLALGGTGDLLAAAASGFEPFGWFRRAHRYLYVAQLPIAILAAEGLDQLLRLDAGEPGQRIARALRFAGGAALVVFGIGFAVNQKPNLEPQPLRDAFLLAAVSWTLTTWLSLQLLCRRGRNRTLLGYVAAGLVALDLWFAHTKHIEKGMHPVPATPRDGELAGLSGLPLDVRIYDRTYLKYRPGVRLGVRDLGGYEDDPLALSRYHRVLEKVRRAPGALGHLNVGWLLEGDGKELRGDRRGLAPVRKGVSRVESVAPAVMWVDRAILVDGPEAAAEALFGAPPGRIAVIEGAALGPADRSRAQRDDGSPGVIAGRLLELERNRLVAEVAAPADGIVVVHEAYLPGWTARVDGERADLIPANAAFRGILVGPGRHRIEMEYRPRGWLTLALVSLLGFLGTALIALRPVLPARRRALPP